MPDLTSSVGPSLPKLSGGGSVSDSSLSYLTASASTLLNEGWDKVTSTFSDIKNNFTKASVSAPPKPSAAATETQGTARQINQETQSSDSTDDSVGHKVKLVSSAGDGETLQVSRDVNFPVEQLSQRTVEFDVMPEVQEMHSTEYEPVSTPHMPTEFQKYRGTKATTWQINGTFICRTRAEAYRNYVYLNNLRSWTKPYFGEKQRLQFDGGGERGKLGAPPPVLKFSGWRGLAGEVPVVINQLSWNFPKDCDWIPCGVFDSEGKEVPFPTVMTVNVSMVESFSPDQVNGFDLVAFRNGRMVNAWLGSDDQPLAYDRAEPVGSNGGNQSVANGVPQGVAATAGTIAGTTSPKTSTADFLSRAKSATGGIIDTVGSAILDTSTQIQNYMSPPVPPIQFGDFPAEATSIDAVISQTTDEA